MNLLKSFAIIASVVIVVAGAGYALQTYSRVRERAIWTEEGPEFIATSHLLYVSNGTSGSPATAQLSYPAVTQSYKCVQTDIAIQSLVPSSLSRSGSYNLTDMNQVSNPYEVMLYQGVANSTGILKGYLSSEFYNITREWQSFLLNERGVHTYSVSLTLYATFQFETGNSTLNVYQYYDNIPYDPFNSSFLHPQPYIISNFNLNLYFDLSQTPRFVLPLPVNSSTSAAPASIGGGGGCTPENCHDTTTVVYTNTSKSWLPFVIGNLTNTNENSEFIFGTATISGNLNLSFNSNSGSALGTGVVGGILMSQNPSWHGQIDTNAYGGEFSVQPIPANENVSMIWIPVTLHTVRTKTMYYACDGSTCVYHGESYSTSVEISYVSSFNSSTTFLANLKNSPFWGDVLGAMGYSLIEQKTLTPGQNNVQVNMSAIATGYTSAASAEQKAVNAASVFVATVGLAMAIDTATSEIPLAGTAADAVNDVNVALAAAGLSLSILSAFESISYGVNAKITTSVLLFTNVADSGTAGTTLTANMYQSPATTTLTTSSGTYSPNMPEFFINVVPS